MQFPFLIVQIWWEPKLVYQDIVWLGADKGCKVPSGFQGVRHSGHKEGNQGGKEVRSIEVVKEVENCKRQVRGNRHKEPGQA